MVEEGWVMSDAPDAQAHDAPTAMLFLFLEKNYAFDWKDNLCS